MQIRPLTSADAAEYRALRLRALREHPEAFRSSYEEEVLKADEWSARRLAADGHGVFLGAFGADGVLIGTVGLQLEPRAKLRHQGQVIGMYVAPEHAHRGVGRALLDAVIARARALEPLEALTLTVTSSNEHALRLYRRAGFVECGREPRALKLDGRYYDKSLMYLALRAE